MHTLPWALSVPCAGRRFSADRHARLLTGDPTWYTNIIEPSLRGASEVRRCFLRDIPGASHSVK